MIGTGEIREEQLEAIESFVARARKRLAANDLPAGSPVMHGLTVYLDFWLPAGQHYAGTAAGDTTYSGRE